MRARTWPVLRLVFSTPLDDEWHERLLLDVDDCGVSALDEDGDIVSLFFAAASDRDAAVDLLASRGWPSQATLSTEDVADEGWAARSQANLPAIRVGRIVVAPPWDVPAPDAAADLLVIEVEPSTGFGTGHHQTTRLCLRALQDLDLRGARVLDIGTGSGVLAVAAVRLGAAEALGIDNDPDAIESAEDTLRRNGLEAGAAVRMELRGLDDRALLASDVVCANLTGALLRQQGGRVQALLVPGGRAVLSGFTEDEARWVRDAFDACDVEATHEEEFWVAYVLRRRAATSQA
ncbi:Ribosomal protein L11 methyltransferase [Luteitalea pratensis]|uniref:Ribosomal protein L11 methyltransferase n=1 Tax=Luteitalea pratensis TaxID=1855912 RepID=A0A143PSL8_LUTPR|nr:50S ribosomal protein L11 methyltransferase [Luteitalea pratensis]AMY11148.1 Ribosomal protein L11 methyltransferase [Luteitalea pratensis]